MTTERDIRNQIRYAEMKGLAEGMEKGKEQGREEVAREMLKEQFPAETIARLTGLTEDRIRAL